MSTTPSDPNIVNSNALEGFMRAFDHAIAGKYSLDAPEPLSIKQLMVVKYVERVERRKQQQQAQRVSIWHTFPPLKTILRIRDNIRLRRYNREWIKNNIH